MVLLLNFIIIIIYIAISCITIRIQEPS